MIKIGIVDSGVNIKHNAFKDYNVKGYSLSFNEEGNLVRNESFQDNIGHGTAVYYLILKHSPVVEITNIKIYDEEVEINQSDFEDILEYISGNENFDILHFSMGIVNCGSTKRMQELVNRIHEKGTIIVSAFDNDGAISFPAALDNVIGVDSDSDIKTLNDFKYVENSIVNIIGKARLQKVAWVNPEYNMVLGNSFTSCYVTGAIATKLTESRSFNLQDICTSTISFLPIQGNSLPFKIKKAAVFPFNKEIHSLVRYEDLLDFEIIGYYAPRISGQVGSKVSKYIQDMNSEKVIENFADIKWEEIDTIIVGHLDKISSLSKKDYKKDILDAAIKHKVNIYSFDVFDNYCTLEEQKQLNIFTPRITKDNVPNTFGKLYKTNKPILSIVGTSSSQGKFTLQLYLRKKFLESGYKVGQIGTEHSCLLFGFDHSFPCGYNSTVKLNIFDTYVMMNELIRDLSEKDVEIIITGSQSGLLCYNDNTVNMFPTYHQIVFEAIQSDAIIVCVNPYDDLKYVERIVKTAEGLSPGKVVGFVCFPIDRDIDWRGDFGKTGRISEEKENNLKKIYNDYFNRDLYILDRHSDLDALYEKCLEFFS